MLFPLLIMGQQRDTINFHLLSEFALNKEEHNKIKKGKEIYRQVSSIGDTLSNYEVTKIDSLGQYYLIEVKNLKYIYKILSIKRPDFDKSNCIETIKVGKIYYLDLRSLENDNWRIHIDSRRVGFPLGMSSGSLTDNDTEYYDLYGEWRIKLGLYSKAKNLEGLCLIKYAQDNDLDLAKRYLKRALEADFKNLSLSDQLNITTGFAERIFTRAELEEGINVSDYVKQFNKNNGKIIINKINLKKSNFTYTIEGNPSETKLLRLFLITDTEIPPMPSKVIDKE